MGWRCGAQAPGSSMDSLLCGKGYRWEWGVEQRSLVSDPGWGSWLPRSDGSRLQFSVLPPF